MLFTSVATLAMTIGGAAYAAFPNIGDDTAGPSLIITFTDSGVTTAANPAYGSGAHPYDGSDDVYFGVINNSSAPISNFNISSTSFPPIGEFDGDGINTGLYLNIPNNAMDTSGYGGPNAFFTNIAANLESLTVNFIAPIAANGGSDIFSLESAATLSNIVVGTPEPSTWAMMLAGFAGMGYLAYRRRGSKTALAAA
jgi:PEP-CTERM motif-containing protein